MSHHQCCDVGVQVISPQNNGVIDERRKSSNPKLDLFILISILIALKKKFITIVGKVKGLEGWVH